MGFILTTVLRTLAQDLPLILVTVICMFLVLQVYLPKTSQKRKWLMVLLIETFEHAALPFLIVFTLILTDSWISAFLFHLILLSFLFLFLGKIVVKAKTKEEWFRISAVAGFTYFFVFVYPWILITVQLYTSIRGWLIMGITILFFIVFYLLKKN